jgi:hypothetical protein
MKFYADKGFWNLWNKIINNNLTCIYYDSIAVRFFKNGNFHNSKNAAYINYSNYKQFKQFCLNGKLYGDNDDDDFTKCSWRKFTKLQAFL